MPMVTVLKVESSIEHVLLRDISWETFESLIQELESQPSKRLTYDHGLLEIWMLLPPHESFKRWLGRIVETLTEEMGCEIRSLSSTTWRRKDLKKGVEADECYYIQNEAVIPGRMDLDLTIDPPPDLAIEVDMTNLSLSRLPIYSALGVPEVWRFDGEKVQVLKLQSGEYVEMERSIVLPLVTPEVLQEFLTQVQTMGETSWAKMIRNWMRAALQIPQGSQLENE
jgi:Uma2 family endonuclease